MSIYIDIEVLEDDAIDAKPWGDDSVVAFIASHWSHKRRSQSSIFATKKEWVAGLNKAEDDYLGGMGESTKRLYVYVGGATLSMERDVFDRLAIDVIALAQATNGVE